MDELQDMEAIHIGGTNINSILLADDTEENKVRLVMVLISSFSEIT